MINLMRSKAAVLILIIAAATATAAEVPPFQGRITDAAGLLSQNDRLSLNAMLADYENKTSNQIFVLTIPSLEGEDIEGFSIKAAREYKVGQKDANTGVLIIVASKERKLRIEVGYGLEGSLPDGRAGQIIRQTISPYFKQNDYKGGIAAGAQEIMRVLSPDYQLPASNLQKPPKPLQKPSKPVSPVPFLIIGGALVGILGLVGFAYFARQKRCPRCGRWKKEISHTVIDEATAFSSGYNRQNEHCPECGFAREFFYTTPPIAAGVYWGGGGWGGGSSGGSDGGGGSDFGSGGGGDFGGGGASGDY